ncbi:MAG: hypothetical protein O2827_01975 [Verrucomicrobia bacterium]|nr:hypothetical protein [Verrucomicrobiota bacterium]
MPEFEEPNPSKDEAEAYSPRNDSKPRSRRRSGGFKNDSAPTQDLNIGEIDPSSVEAETTQEQPQAEKEAPVEASKETRAPEPKKNKAPLNQDTLRVIQELEEKITEKKQVRQARFADKRSRGKPSKKQSGLFGGIANFFASLFGKKTKQSKGRPRNRRYSKGKNRRPYSKNKNR